MIRRAQDRAAAGDADVREAFTAAVAADPTPAARGALADRLAAVDPQQAIDEWEAAWDAARRMGSPRWRAVCCDNLARLWRRCGDVDCATRFEQLVITAQMETEEFAETGALQVGLPGREGGGRLPAA